MNNRIKEMLDKNFTKLNLSNCNAGVYTIYDEDEFFKILYELTKGQNSTRDLLNNKKENNNTRDVDLKELSYLLSKLPFDIIREILIGANLNKNLVKDLDFEKDYYIRYDSYGSPLKITNDTDWDKLAMERQLGELFIYEFRDRLNWDIVSKYQDLSMEFMEREEIINRLNWDLISEFQNFDEYFIARNLNKLNLKIIFRRDNLNIDYDIFHTLMIDKLI